jgi:hypothetical protein
MGMAVLNQAGLPIDGFFFVSVSLALLVSGWLAEADDVAGGVGVVVDAAAGSSDLPLVVVSSAGLVSVEGCSVVLLGSRSGDGYQYLLQRILELKI